MQTTSKSRLKPSTTKVCSLGELHRALYLAVSSKMPAFSRNDPEAVKPLRDHITMEYYGKIYNEMTQGELIGLIAQVNSSPAFESNVPTYKQQSTLRFYMFSVGLVYANMSGWEYLDKLTGAILSGEDLRSLLIYQFYEGETKLPAMLMRRLYDEWINPKSNTFLMEGGFKKLVRDPNKLYYERLSKQEVQYLMNRYGAIYNQKINKSVKPVRAHLN